jgi:hypothetical protein
LDGPPRAAGYWEKKTREDVITTRDNAEFDLMPDVPPEERRAVELAKRVRQLRWMGMDSEIETLQVALRRLRRGATVIDSAAEGSWTRGN